MTFLHVTLLGGVLAVAVPIVLHLIMRQQPKHLEFPALRFIKARQTNNRRSMRLRHWLLLLARCALLALLALALARPSIVASGMLGDQEAPVAAAFVFDTSPRMQYRQQNKSRLEVAQDAAQWLLPQLPPQSDVSVVDSRYASAAFAVDLGAARQRIERLDAQTMTRPLAEAIAAGLKLVRDSDKQRKEVYVFTDLSSATWANDAMRELGRTLRETRDTGIYLIDVGATDPVNYGLGELRLSGQVLSANGVLSMQCDLLHAGPGGERSVELHLLDRDSGQSSMRGQQLFSFQPGQSERTDFRLSGLSPGLHQGYLKIAGQDALPADDTRWFSVAVRPAWKVLIAAPDDAQRRAAEYALFLSEALSPREMRLKGQATFECEVISTDRLAWTPLADYSAVCLLDPRPLPADTWQLLRSYVAAGGGLGIFLGRNATPVEAFNESLTQGLLPAKLVRQWRANGEVHLAPDDFQHPILSKFQHLDVAWEQSPVFRHWQLGEMVDGAAIVLRYSNGQPAILERPVGAGRVIVSTTPLSDAASGDAWNLLPVESSLTFFILANETTHYLIGNAQQRLNYTTGDTAVLHLAPEERHPFFVLTSPRGDQLRVPSDERQNAVVVTSTEAPGNYRLQAGGGDRKADLGFSASLPASISQLERASEADLAGVFGETPFRLARNREEIDRSVSAGRVGRELYPILILLAVLFLVFEQVLSNRFYQDYDTARVRSAAAQWAATAPPDSPTKKPETSTKTKAVARG